MSVIEALTEAASVRHRLPFKLSIAFLLNVLYTTLAHLKLYVLLRFSLGLTELSGFCYILWALSRAMTCVLSLHVALWTYYFYCIY